MRLAVATPALYFREKRYLEAVALARSLCRKGCGGNVRLAEAMSLYELGSPFECLWILSSLSLDTYEYHLYYGLACVSAGDKDCALRHLYRALEFHTADPRVLEAISRANMIRSPPDPGFIKRQTFLERIRTAEAVQGWKAAVNVCNEALASYPNDPHFLLLRNSLYLSGDPSLALQDADSVLASVDMGEYRSELLVNRASALASLGRELEALEIYRKLGDNPSALFNHGSLLMKLHDYAAAESCFRKLVSVYPTPGAFAGLVSALLQQGRVSEAYEAAEKGVSEFPSDSMSHNNLGFVLSIMKRDADAEAEYRKAISLDPSNALARGNLASLRRQRRKR